MPKKEKGRPRKYKTLESIVEHLKSIPYTSKEYRSTVKRLARLLESKYGDQYIMVVPEGETSGLYIDENIYEIFGIREAFDPNNNGIIRYMPRNEVEYDMAYNQIIVSAYITDGTKYVLLEKKDKDKTVTFIQGHVDFSLDAYRMNLDEFLINNMLRELEEEVYLNSMLKWSNVIRSIDLIAYIDIKESTYDLFNNGVIYEIRVDSVDELIGLGLTTGEPENHNIRVFDEYEYILSNKNNDSWVSKIFSMDIITVAD